MSDEPITGHPYEDNNGPTMMLGVCRYPGCGKHVFEHATRKTQKKKGARIYVVPVQRDSDQFKSKHDW